MLPCFRISCVLVCTNLFLVFDLTHAQVSHGDIKGENGSSLTNPNVAIAHLLRGNERYRSGLPIHPDQSLSRIKELSLSQHPFAIIVSCSDSRVSPELVFDQGLGDLFVIRTAGNIIGEYELASIEYAVEHLGSHLIIVMGHDSCGAIGAYLEHQKDSLPNHIQSIIDYIKAEPEEKELLLTDSELTISKAVVANVEHGVNLLRESEPVLKVLYRQHKLEIIGALYHLETGTVDIFK